MIAIGDLLPKTNGEHSESNYEKSLQRQCEFANRQIGNLTEFDCPECLNRGHYKVVVGIYMFSKECRCMIKRRNMKLLEKSGLSKLADKYTFDNYSTGQRWQHQIKASAIEFTKNNKGWFFIGGQVGSGKTHICSAIALEFMNQGKPAHYMLYRDEITQLKKTVMDADYDTSILKLKTIDVLYIDDLFKTEKGKLPTTADIQIMFEVLNHRYNTEKITIFSSEKTLEEILEIDEAIGSRIFECAKKHLVKISHDGSKNMRLNYKTLNL